MPPRRDVVMQPKRMTMTPAAPCEQAHAPARVLPVPAAAPSAPQNRAEYGYFNEERLQAIAAHAASDDDSDRSSVPAPTLPLPTGTNAQPLVPRKRKGPDSKVTHAAASKRQKSAASEMPVTAGTGLSLDPHLHASTGPDDTTRPAQGYSCIGCVNMELTNCDGQAHCSNCTSSKCKYILCEIPKCTNERCVKIHHHQYNLNARKSGETRMMVIYDNQKEKVLTMPEKVLLRGALARMNALRSGSTTSTSETMLQLGAPVSGQQVNKEKDDGLTRPTSLQTGAPLQGTNMGPAINNRLWQARFTQLLGGQGGPQLEHVGATLDRQGASLQADFGTNPLQTRETTFAFSSATSAFGGDPWKLRNAQATFSTGGQVFGSRTWHANGTHDKGKLVDRGEPSPSQASPFAIPQAVRNATLKAQMSAASAALTLRMGNAIRKDGDRSGDPQIKVEESDDEETN